MLSFPLKLKILIFPVIYIVLICLNSCTAPVSSSNPALSRQLRAADSLIVAGKYKDGKKALQKIRPEIPEDDPFTPIYYCYQASLNHAEPKPMNSYADSALAFFVNPARIEQYPFEYKKTLLTKGDACVRARKYVAALNYYAKSKIIKPANFCDNGEIDEKIGGIYYDQGNYLIAARYFVERLRRVFDCSDHTSREKQFITLEGILNNIGYFYEQASLPDSAIYYYQKDIKLIDSAEKHKLEALRNINAAKAVVYDNLGGLYAKLGETTRGKNLLIKSIQFSNEETDRSKVGTYVKLANIYIRSGEFKKAGESLVNGEQLLKKYTDSDPDFKSRWIRTYAAYLFKTKRFAQAYIYLNDYISHKDSMVNSRSELYHLDIAREITNLQRQSQFADFQQKEKLRKLYQLGIVLISVLSAVIIILIVRNLRKCKKPKKKQQRTTNSYNKQLQKQNVLTRTIYAL
jgi:tetratricopeptide (TPR) repeat protein